MPKALYSVHYKLRRAINYCLLQGYYRFKYPGLMRHKNIFRALSYSPASVKFVDIQKNNAILSSSEYLNSDSIVFDVGGETGIWSKEIYSKYEPNLYVFEPHPRAVKILEETFAGKKAKIFPYGLGSKNESAKLSDSGMGSSIYDSSTSYAVSEKFDIEIRDIAEVIKELELDSIDLIKINIEGGEYDLVPHMIKTGMANQCKIIRIQFHDWIPNAFEMRKKIVRELSKTHDVEWSYPLVWESWIRKDMKR